MSSIEIDEKQKFPKTLAERVYLYLRDSILSGQLKANQRVQESEVAAHFGISSTPVREAILRLSGEGLIRTTSHKEAFVKDVSYKELIDIYYVMNFVDAQVMLLALDMISDDAMNEIIKMTAEMEEVCSKETVQRYLEINEKIHLKICESCGNLFLYEIRRYIYAHLSRYNSLRFFLFAKSGVMGKNLDELKLLLAALKLRDIKKLRRLTHRHWIQYLPSESEWKAYLAADQKVK